MKIEEKLQSYINTSVNEQKRGKRKLVEDISDIVYLTLSKEQWSLARDGQRKIYLGKLGGK